MKVTLGRIFAVGHRKKCESSVKMAKFFVSQDIWSYDPWGAGPGPGKVGRVREIQRLGRTIVANHHLLKIGHGHGR